ncbi:MAG: neutral/alkaline non-lysosomal ceramidase N-terminal domain-containing protein [Victivallales bacterium]|nr:neutral/alkaline non-lysosomal ceramidase N-terminal domain-containing protein [Victivallales bacterium]
MANNTLNAGFSRIDITPRVGVELTGYLPWPLRASKGVLAPLEARGIALKLGESKACIVCCDLCLLSPDVAEKTVQAVLKKLPFLTRDNLMVLCSHTHSAPSTCYDIGNGMPDPVYMELLPHKIALAAAKAFENMTEVTVSHAEVPCRQIAINRVYDKFWDDLDNVLKDDWQPNKPELTDPTCHVVRFDAVEGGLKGFFVYYGCHLVSAGISDLISPDFAGVALHEIMRENPGAVGCFIQGAEGDINTGCASAERAEECIAILSRRFATSVRNGLEQAKPMKCDELQCVSIEGDFSYLEQYTPDYVQGMVKEYSAKIFTDDATDADTKLRWNMVYLKGSEKLLKFISTHSAIHARINALRLGDLEILGAPFEIMSAIWRDTRKAVKAPIPLVASLCNGTYGYAPDNTQLEKLKNDEHNFAGRVVPMIWGLPPYKNIHNELVAVFKKTDERLFGK